MAKSEFLARLAEVFEVDHVDDDFVVQDKWDSLVVLAAISAIDEEFGITVPVKELTDTHRVSDILALVERPNVKS